MVEAIAIGKYSINFLRGDKKSRGGHGYTLDLGFKEEERQ
jgi:hypothetical protein